MPNGTYGSGASAAATKRDAYFVGEGVLTVTADATARGTLISVQ
jgi:hypothetical protein